MNEKIAHQIEKMKKQTIGVEVEMNNIKRDKAARLAADFFGTGRYENTASRNGYMTWSAWDEQGREWKFQKDVSIAGDDAHKCEMVTPILKYEDMETLQELIRKLRKAGTKSDATRGCGVHIHIGAKGHTPQTMRNLANIMASHESLIAEALDLDRGRMRRYCRTVDPRFLEQVNKKKPKTMSKLADIWYGSQDCSYGRNQHYNASGAERAYRRAVDKLTELLVAEGAIHAVRLKQKSKTKRKRKSPPQSTNIKQTATANGAKLYSILKAAQGRLSGLLIGIQLKRTGLPMRRSGIFYHCRLMFSQNICSSS